MKPLKGSDAAVGRERKQNPIRQERIAAVDEVAIWLRIKPFKEGGYVAASSDAPGLVAEGHSVTEAVEIAQGLARKIVESCLENRDPLPPASVKARRAACDLVVPVGIR